MLKPPVLLALFLSAGAATAQAATIVEFTGASTGSMATGSASLILAPDGLSVSGSITNTAPDDARITAFGFDVGSGNLNGYSGTPDNITIPVGVDFNFDDGDVGNIAQFNGVDLDFAYLTGNNFNGGSPNDGLDNFQTLSFMITGDFANLSEAEIAAGLLVRFQRVGPNGELSDVASVTETVIPEPGSMLLLGTGLAYLARRRYRREQLS